MTDERITVTVELTEANARNFAEGGWGSVSAIAEACRAALDARRPRYVAKKLGYSWDVEISSGATVALFWSSQLPDAEGEAKALARRLNGDTPEPVAWRTPMGVLHLPQQHENNQRDDNVCSRGECTPLVPLYAAPVEEAQPNETVLWEGVMPEGSLRLARGNEHAGKRVRVVVYEPEGE